MAQAVTKYGDISPRTAAFAAKAMLEGTTPLAPIVTINKPIPEPDPSWSDETKEAHRALHSGLQTKTVKFRRRG